MHDALEGFVKDTRLILTKYIEQNVISLDELNERIKGFDYGYSEKVSKLSLIKPQHLQNSGKLHQTASQMWMLSTMLHLILVNFVGEDCPYMTNYRKMLEILSISFAEKIHIGMIEYLSEAIQEYLVNFGSLYKENIPGEDRLKNFTPKQHFLINFPRLLTVFGPLIRYWTMRMEAKHQFLKRIVQALRNYKNLTLTLAKKYQLFQAYFLYGSLKKGISSGPIKIVSVHRLDFADLFPEKPELETVSWVSSMAPSTYRRNVIFRLAMMKMKAYHCLGNYTLLFGKTPFLCLFENV